MCFLWNVLGFGRNSVLGVDEIALTVDRSW